MGAGLIMCFHGLLLMAILHYLCIGFNDIGVCNADK